MSKLDGIRENFRNKGARNYLKWAAAEIPLYTLGTSLAEDLLEYQRRLVMVEGNKLTGRWLYDKLSYLNDAVQWYSQHEDFFSNAIRVTPYSMRKLLNAGLIEEGLEVGPQFKLVKPHLVTAAIMTELADELHQSGYISREIHNGLMDFFDAFGCSIIDSLTDDPHDGNPMMAYYAIFVTGLTEEDNDWIDYYGPIFKTAT